MKKQNHPLFMYHATKLFSWKYDMHVERAISEQPESNVVIVLRVTYKMAVKLLKSNLFVLRG